MKTVSRLMKRFADRLDLDHPYVIWKEVEYDGSGSWWASLKEGWTCQATEAGSCHESTLRELERALRSAKRSA